MGFRGHILTQLWSHIQKHLVPGRLEPIMMISEHLKWHMFPGQILQCSASQKKCQINKQEKSLKTILVLFMSEIGNTRFKCFAINVRLSELIKKVWKVMKLQKKSRWHWADKLNIFSFHVLNALKRLCVISIFCKTRWGK